MKITFRYPENVFVKETPDGKTIFIDTQTFAVPEVFWGPLTPMQVGGMSSTKPKEETVTGLKDMFEDPKVKNFHIDNSAAIEISGTVKQEMGYIGGRDYVIVLVPITSSRYIQVNFYQEPRFSKENFDQILSTFKFLD